MNSKLLTSTFSIAIVLFIGVVLPAYGDDVDIPPFAKEMLQREGLTFNDLKNDPALRQKWLKKFQEMQGKGEADVTSEKPAKSEQGRSTRRKPSNEASQDDFYKVIVDNNLFRPLGYRKPEPGPAFELIATVVNSQTGRSKALIRNHSDQKIYYAGVGEKIADARIEKIEPLKVTLLHNGESKEFRASQVSFLNRGGGGGGGGSGGGPPPPQGGRPSGPPSRGGEFRGSPNPKMMEQMKQDLKNFPPEVREKIIQDQLRRPEGQGAGEQQVIIRGR